MSLVIDQPSLEVIKPTANGTEVPLTEEQKREVVFFKYVSTNDLISDIQPTAPWRLQIVADMPMGSRQKPRLLIGDRGIRSDDGLIIDLSGEPDGVYGYIDGLFRSEEETDHWEDNVGQEAPRAVRWAFHVTRILRTNGPELRERYWRTQEQRAEEEKASMFEAIRQAFEKGTAAAAAKGDFSPDPQKLLESISAEDLEALAKRKRAEKK